MLKFINQVFIALLSFSRTLACVAEMSDYNSNL